MQNISIQFGFIRQLPANLAKISVGNVFCQLVMFEHPVHIEVFNRDDAKVRHQKGGQLMGGIIPSLFEGFYPAETHIVITGCSTRSTIIGIANFPSNDSIRLTSCGRSYSAT